MAAQSIVAPTARGRSLFSQLGVCATDCSLLCDAVRVLDRLLRRVEEVIGFSAFHRQLKRAKRRAMEILHLAAQAAKERRRSYRELLEVTETTVDLPTPRVRSRSWSIMCIFRRS